MQKTLLLGGIVLQAIFSFANALTLQDNFQALTIPVPKACSQAYGKTLPSCTEDDFQKNSKCSSACVNGLTEVAQSVNAACSHVVVGSSTLLGRIFQGQIVPSLCPNNGKTTSSSSSNQASTSKSAVPATTEHAASTTSAAGSQSSASTETSSSASSAAQSSSTDSASDTASSAATTSTPLSSAAPSGSTSTSSAAPATSVAPAAGGRFGLTVQQQQIQAVSKSGGGSPFDIVGYTASANKLSEYGIGMILTGTALLLAGFWA